MKLTILGSGTHIPVKNRSNPAYLLDIADECILLDCGSGTLRQIARAHRSEWEIDKIFLSHLHIDHTMDLVPLFFTFKYQPQENHNPKIIKIYAHSQFSQLLENIENIYGKWIKNEKRPYEHIEILPNQMITGNYKIETFRADHSDHSIIYRFTDDSGKIFVYSGDTGPSEELIRAAYKADLLLIEGTCPTNQKLEGHLSAKDIIKVIQKSKPSKTVITHLHPENDNKRYISQFNPQNTVIAKDLDVFEI